MTKSKIFLWICLSFISGIFINSIFSLSQPFLLGFLILSVFLISIFWEKKKIVFIGFCFLFFFSGLVRMEAAKEIILNSQLTALNDTERTISLTGEVVAEPDLREDNAKITVQPDGINGKILVTVNRYSGYHYGDRLKLTGKLKTPAVFTDFNYKDYLSKDGIYSVMYWPEVELIETSQGNFFYEKILQIKDSLRNSVYQNLSPPQSSVLGAIILGDKRNLSEDLKEKLNITGLRHVTAISGMHIMIMAGALMSLFISFKFTRSKAFYLTIFFLFLFILMVGAPSSAIRAGIMGGLVLFAAKIGRPKTASRAIILAATAMLVFNPLLLKSDVGFQLSFLATIGIVYLTPFFKKWLKVQVLSMTLAAQIFTLPLLVYNFGYISLIAPITNLLIVPLIPLIMILGFLSGLAGLFWQSLGWVFSFPAWLFLTYLVKVADFFSQLSFSAVFFEISWVWLAVFYFFLISAAYWLNKKEKIW